MGSIMYFIQDMQPIIYLIPINFCQAERAQHACYKNRENAMDSGL